MYDVALCDVIVKDSLVSDCESVDALKKMNPVCHRSVQICMWYQHMWQQGQKKKIINLTFVQMFHMLVLKLNLPSQGKATWKKQYSFTIYVPESNEN